MTMDEGKIRLAASAAMSDSGVSLPLRTVLRKKPVRVTMRIPTTQSFLRVARLYNGMGVTREEVEGYDFDQYMRFVERHGRTVSRIVAYGVVRGFLLGRLLNRPAAWLLRNLMDPRSLAEAWRVVLETADTRDFGLITASAGRTDRTAPAVAGRAGRTG